MSYPFVRKPIPACSQYFVDTFHIDFSCVESKQVSWMPIKAMPVPGTYYICPMTGYLWLCRLLWGFFIKGLIDSAYIHIQTWLFFNENKTILSHTLSYDPTSRNTPGFLCFFGRRYGRYRDMLKGADEATNVSTTVPERIDRCEFSATSAKFGRRLWDVIFDTSCWLFRGSISMILRSPT